MTFEPRVIDSSDGPAIAALLDSRVRRDMGLERRVAGIVDRVRRLGDRAVDAYARQFDKLEGPVEVTRAGIDRAARQLPRPVRQAIAAAAANITRVATRQVPQGWSVAPVPGVRITQRVLPLDRVGCYVPAGRYPLPSSLLMTAIPASVAGVRDIIAVCPRPDAAIMYAAQVAGVSRLYRLGGAHAIAALAYGTETIPAVDKIVGPGNAYVAAAKAIVSSRCAIDFHAGPSEIAVVSQSGQPRWIAADLLAQAEHDPDARAVLLTPSRRLARAVARELGLQIASEGPARAALSRNGGIIVTRSLAEAIALCNRMAPEHVVCDTDAVAARVTRAGTVFVGDHSAQASGDYATGSNHVLPTSGAARARGGLSAADFVRVTTVQRVTAAGLRRIGPSAVTLARAEGLAAHAASIQMRLEPGSDPKSWGAGSDPKPWGTGSDPKPWGTGSDPKSWGTGSDPKSWGAGSDPRPRGTGSDPKPWGTGSDPRPWGTGSDPKPRGAGSDPRGRIRSRRALAGARKGGR
jgi:histidinol dehydrogenase